MFKRFASRNQSMEEVKNGTYQNSRILVFRNRDAKATLPYELQIDFEKQTIRFVSADAAWDHAVGLLDERRRQRDLETMDASLAPALA